jgi:hypothetical protein
MSLGRREWGGGLVLGRRALGAEGPDILGHEQTAQGKRLTAWNERVWNIHGTIIWHSFSYFTVFSFYFLLAPLVEIPRNLPLVCRTEAPGSVVYTVIRFIVNTNCWCNCISGPATWFIVTFLSIDIFLQVVCSASLFSS